MRSWILLEYHGDLASDMASDAVSGTPRLPSRPFESISEFHALPLLPSNAMTSRSAEWLRNPLFLLCLTAGLLAFVVQSGELGSADTMHRLQTTHWLWTSQPQVFPNEYPEFGLHGRDGKIYSWYGIGQSLLMLPSDLVGTWISHWRMFADYEDDPAVRSIVVSYSTSILVNVLTALITFRFLRQLRFDVREAISGVLTLMFCTTHLHYTQNMMENNYIMLLTLVGFSYQLEWLRSGNRKALLWGSVALGLNLLTRVTTALDLIAAGVFLFAVLWFERRLTVGFCGNEYLATAKLRCQFTFSLRSRSGFTATTALDRFCRVISRFSLANRACRIRACRQIFPGAHPFTRVFSARCSSPRSRSSCLIPCLCLRCVTCIGVAEDGAGRSRLCRDFPSAARRLYRFYAKYTYWSGDFAWGDRYVSSVVEMVALLSMPLLLRYRTQLSDWVWRLGMFFVAVSLVVQVASLAFWLPLEIYQMETFGHPTFVIALRFKNIVAFALGKMQAWGLNTDDMGYDQWDYVHITTWNFLPFLLRRVGAAPRWVVDVAFVIWGSALAALAGTLWRLKQALTLIPNT